MSLSDELFRHRNLDLIRRTIIELISELDASSAFLVDEAGIVFAACGHMEFRFPNPHPELSGLPSDKYILEALLGEDRKEKESPFVLFKVSPRALFVIGFESTLRGRQRRAIKARLEKSTEELKKLLEI
jgi:hypothetical protein